MTSSKKGFQDFLLTLKPQGGGHTGILNIGMLHFDPNT